MASKTRRNITLDADVDDLLDRVGNASEYLSRVVRDRWRNWQDGLSTLESSGWRSADVLAACDSLNGVWLVGVYRSRAALALELSDSQSLNGICGKWDIAPEHWTECVRQVAEAEHISGALLDVVSEFWADNAACEQAIRRLGAATATADPSS